jgi:RNA polymerase sigma-70 factor (ECF subfamily)
MPWKRQSNRFEQVALPFLPDVYRIARQMSDSTRADDLVQETFLRAFKYFDGFEEGSNCRAWLMRILHNVCTDHWRRTRPELSFEEREESFAEPYYDWEDQFIRDELSPLVEAALAKLPEPNRWAVLLSDVEELSYREIALVMNCPIGTVMSRLNRGRRALAELLRASNERALEQASPNTGSGSGDKG